MSLLEKQQEVIKYCHQIYEHYITLEIMDWDNWWNKTVPFMDKKFGVDDDIRAFMEKRMIDLFRELRVIKDGELWPLR